MIGRFRQQDDTDPVEPKGFDDYEFRLGDVMRGERATLGKSLLDVQRELKIKATYVAAIENSDPTAFETPGFIAGYVRSYARYLDLDPEWAYRAFCAESGFATAHGMSQAASSRRAEPAREEDAPFGSRNLGVSPPGESLFSRIEPGAIGSVAVLLGLIGVLGYGGYRVLNEVQKVQFVPVDQAPEVVADIDPLDGAAPIPTETDDPARTAMIDDGFDRLYRPQALDVPVMVARDAPISTLDPRRAGALAGQGTVGTPPGTEAPAPVMDLAGLDAFGGPGPDRPEEPAAPQVVADTVPEVVVFAVRPSWVRVRSADGTTLYEKIMDEGDRFVLPRTEKPATLRTGESGAIFFAVNGQPYGPAGPAGQVTGNLALSAETLTQAYGIADLSADTALARVVVELQQDPPRLPGRADPVPAGD
ncbi:helix-turn-helix domain-containing protein [Palleronia rufa]|uniref:helix-turn-helix domain-containing protein n=1 Tax=Palleronia rufa TaxID=1530186 RepID=UPI00056AE71B|nr:helix-turn-helix domain-containing protein [Palleronia rufa]